MMRSRAAAPIVGWVRRALKVLGVEVVGRLLFYSGVLYLVGTAHRYLGRRRLLVPMYHRVRPAGSAAADALVDIEVGIGADRLEQPPRLMSWFGAFLPLEEAYDHLHA